MARKANVDERLSIRVNATNPDHHLWNNNGTWFVHFTVHRPDFTKQRVRTSLGTRDLHVARSRRDRLLHGGDEQRTSFAGDR